MPILRRSKSFNDKIAKQKNRSSVADVIRDPRSPDVEGRTRTCVDNFQALVHMRKQTEDRARQLELAYTYGSNGHTYLRHGVQLPCAGSIRPASVAIVESSLPLELSESHSSVSVVNRGKHSTDNHSARDGGNGLCSQSFSEGRRPLQLVRNPQQPEKCQRPASMIEPGAYGLFPTRDEVIRKDQVIQNLTESHKNLNVHNQKLLSKVEEVEHENKCLKDLLRAHNIPFGAVSQSSNPRPNRVQTDVRIPGSFSFPKQSSTLISPISETSVSGYGSLTGSAYGETGIALGGREGMGAARVMGVGDYDDDTLPLSDISGGRVSSRNNTLDMSSSSGGSRIATLNRESDKSDIDSIHEKLEEVLELERNRGSDRKKRIADLENQVEQLAAQLASVLELYKQAAAENDNRTRRDEIIQGEIRSLLEHHGQKLEEVIQTELRTIQDQLWDLGQDVQVQLENLLTTLASPRSGTRDIILDLELRRTMYRMVDLIGPEYRNLGRRLNVPQAELEAIEDAPEDFAEKTQRVIQSWLRQREGRQEDREPFSRVSPAQELTQALRDIDKDIHLFAHEPISGPERQALRNCLQFAIDHVNCPKHLLDHFIMLEELTPAAFTFVNEVIQRSERALSRLWHVAEYRGTGIISKLALALERSGNSHVSAKLIYELEIQNSRAHSHLHPLSEEPEISATAAHFLGSRPSLPEVNSSRPVARVPRSRSLINEEIRLCVGSPRSMGMPVPVQNVERQVVWDRQLVAGNVSGADAATRNVILEQGASFSEV